MTATIYNIYADRETIGGGLWQVVVEAHVDAPTASEAVRLVEDALRGVK